MLQRRHCQQAASNDARRLTGVVIEPSQQHLAEATSAIDVADHAMPRNADGAREGDTVAAGGSPGDEQRDACIPES